MSFQVVRVETYKKTSLRGLGGETERDGREKVKHKNVDILESLSYKNMFLKKTTQSFQKEFEKIVRDLNVQFCDRKSTDVVDGMVITSDRAFFESLGWRKGMAPTADMKAFFDAAYRWALKQIGYQGTDRNVLSAVIHVDETTPHLHLYYIPVTDRWREKQYARDSDGKILRQGKNPVALRDSRGKIVYVEKQDTEKPRLNRGEFWRVRGGADSYRLLQDSFYADVAQKWQLERGEKGTGRKHMTKQQYEKSVAAVSADSVNYVESIEARQGLLDRQRGTVTVDKDDFQDLKRQALAYATARPVLDSVVDREKAVVSREAEAEKGIRKNQAKERELFEAQFALRQRENAVFDGELELQQKQGQLQQEQERLQQEWKHLKEGQERLQKERDSSGVSQEIATLKETIAQKDTELERVRQESKVFREWAGQLYAEKTGSDTAEKMEKLEKCHAERLKTLEGQYNDQVEGLKERHAERLKTLEGQYNERVEGLEKRHAERLKTLKGQYNDQVKGLKERHAEQVKTLEGRLKDVSAAVQALLYVASALMSRIPEMPYLREAVAVGRDVLESVGLTVSEMPDILRQKALKTSRDGGLGL